MSYGKNVSRQPFLDALSKRALVLLHQQHLVSVPVITLVHRVVDSVNVYPRIIVMLTSICQISVSRSGLLSDSGLVQGVSGSRGRKFVRYSLEGHGRA